MSTQTVSGFWLKGIIACAESQGLSQQAILDEAGVAQLPHAASERVSLDATVNIWNAAIKLTNDSLFGFHMGKQFRPNWFNLIHMIWSNCDNVRSAIRTALNYQTLISEGANLSLVETGTQAVLKYQPNAANLPFSHHQIDAVLTILVSIIRWSISEKFNPKSLHLSYIKDSHTVTTEFQSFFNCPIYYEAPETHITFDKHWLDQPMLGADQQLLDMHIELANRKISELLPTSLSQKISSISIQKKHFTCYNKEEIARQLDLSPRTLQRRLQSESTSFTQLTDNLRKRLAIELIKSRTTTNALVERLDFSEVSSLHKACKRWFGMSLKDYRESLIEKK